MANETGSPYDKPMTFWDHLEELRKRLIFCFVLFVFLAIGCYFVSDTFLVYLTYPLQQLTQKTYFTSPYDAFSVKLQVSFWSAFFLSVPFFLTEAWFFIAPGLYQKEKKFFWIVLLVSVTLFLAGSLIAALFVVPATLGFFLGFSTPQIQPLISIKQYLSFIIWMVVSFGAAFQAPVFLIGLVRLGILGVDQLRKARAYVVVAIFIFAAVITPSPDPLSQCLLAIPLWLLFEASVLVSRFIKPTKN